LKKRKQRMSQASGLSVGTSTGTIQSSQTPFSTTSIILHSESSKQKTIKFSFNKTQGLFLNLFLGNFIHSYFLETSRPVSFKLPHFPLPSPPPPPPKKSHSAKMVLNYLKLEILPILA
jgi:hypothetical protein